MEKNEKQIQQKIDHKKEPPKKISIRRKHPILIRPQKEIEIPKKEEDDKEEHIKKYIAKYVLIIDDSDPRILNSIEL